ncbi:MAG: camp-dependent protein kinase catalytic subunit [Tremellales sp. Tagirdzhanova-0007]|nr:MAG: camp-dependent protein kinase catalytic subunit [Tremellales sp. Tagirdzhanova-0007]
MFAKVSDKFHHRKQTSSTAKSGQPLTPTSSAGSQQSNSTYLAKSALPQLKGTSQQPGNGEMDGWNAGTPMEGIESPPSPQDTLSHSESSVAGSSASSSLSNVHPQARTLSSALGVQGNQTSPSGQSTYQPMNLLLPIASPEYQPNNNRLMSVEMTDESTPKGPAVISPERDSVADEERMREKAREAQEQAAQAQANLAYATQQARVAAINAAATQAALETVATQLPATAKVSAPVNGAAAGQPMRRTAGRYALADFNIERTLGTGSFGRVHLVRSKHNSRFYAVKVLNKEKVIKMKQVEHTNSEREMLVRVRHPFLVNLWGTFQDVNNLYMVMDFVAGGELFSLLRKSQRFPNSVAKFYAAEVALALDYLHSLEIIYRDLKPENLLLGADGHVKVTDFGFAKHVPDITWTLCGTPDYLAPEVVQNKGYNKSVDWYALGVLIFEMLAGYPPFFTEDGNPMKLYEKARKVRYPTYFDVLAKELLKNLLVGDLTKRYGNLRAGSSDIFAHGWFAEVDWDKLYRREIPAPYVPKIDGEGDSSQFDRYQEADEMQMIVYGFPSKVTALQFEWAWQKPELSRHLRVRDSVSEEERGPMFKKDAKRNWLERKVTVAYALLCLPPFSQLPLHLRFFTETTQTLFDELFECYKRDASHPHKRQGNKTFSPECRLPPISPDITMILDLGAMEWGEVIRSCYGRKAGLELERLETGKGDRKARRKAERQAAKGTAQISATEEDSGHESAVSMTDGDAEADVVDQSRTSSRKSGPSGVSPLTKKINSLILPIFMPEGRRRAKARVQVKKRLRAEERAGMENQPQQIWRVASKPHRPDAFCRHTERDLGGRNARRLDVRVRVRIAHRKDKVGVKARWSGKG